MNIKHYTLALWICLLTCLFELFASSVVASGPIEITLAWDANKEVVAGYNVYVRHGERGPPFEFLGDVYVSELADANKPMVTLTELETDAVYYFAVTAFDSEGDESRHSKQLCVEVQGRSVAVCDSGGGGGGGG